MLPAHAALEAALCGHGAHRVAPLRHRPVLPSDAALLRSCSVASPLCELVLAPRFGSFERFFAEAVDKEMRRAFYLSQDAQERLLGWACCFRFHEREGYAGTAQWVAEIGATPTQRQAADEQLSLCIAASRARGINTLVTTLHSAMPQSLGWHAARGFEACGSVDLSGGNGLHVLARRIA